MVSRQAPYMNIGMMLHLYGQPSKVLETQSNLRRGSYYINSEKIGCEQLVF
jgi:hypothetical protein